MKILITGIGGAAGMSVAKSLREFYLIGVDANPNTPNSILVNEFYKIPYAREENFLEELRKISAGCDYMFCTVDEELPIVAKNSEKFGCKVLVSSPESIELCLDKFRLFEHLKSRGLPVPKTVLLEDQNFEDLYSELGPFIAKPRRGRGSEDFFRIKNENYLNLVLSIKKYLGKEFICQTELIGREYTVDILLDEKGKTVVSVPRERIDTNSGVSVVGRTVRDQHIQNVASEVAESLGLRYIVNVQLKENENGELFVTEVNPRPSGTLYLTTLAGVNMPRILLKLLNREEVSPEDLEFREVLMRRITEEKVEETGREDFKKTNISLQRISPE